MRSALSLGLFVLLSQVMLAQTPPRIAVVQPAGGKAGSTVQVTISGQDLEGAEGLHFDFPGAKVEVQGTEAIPEAPTKKAVKKGVATPSVGMKFKIVLPPNAPLGAHDVRVVSKLGVSNPRTFIIGDLDEVLEKEPNDDVPQANKIPLNVTVHGVIASPTDVDYFQFAGKKDQRIVASCLTTSIESKLQAALQIYSSAGVPLGNNRNYQNNDALIDATLPEDGDYFIRLSSFTHTQGGPEYNYRLTVGTMPWIDAVVPSVVAPGKETKVEVIGRNLPGGKLDAKLVLDGKILERASVTVTAPATATATSLALPARSALEGFDLRLPSPSGSSNPYFLAFAKSPVAVEVEPNDTAEKATAVTVPVQVSGRIDRRDVDWFRFPAKKDVPLAIELFADRLNPSLFGSAVDLKFVVVGPDGKTIASLDENPEIMANSFFARSEDPSRYRLIPTADGEYRVGVSSADDLSGPRHAYSLRIAPEDGDFQVLAMPMSGLAPDSATTGPKRHYAFSMVVWRMGSFTGDIVVAGKDLPKGVSMKPQVISGQLKQAAVVVSIAPDASAFTGPIELEATATVDGKKLTRAVRGATITYPVALATIPAVARVDREIVLAIREGAKYALIPSTEKIVIRQGEKVAVSLKLQTLHPDFKATVQATGVGLPTGMNLQPTTLTLDKDVALSFDSKTIVPPGNYTLVLRGQTQAVAPKQPLPKGAPANIVEHAPPISLVIVPKQVFDLTAPGEAINLGRGKNVEAIVKLNRLFPSDGPVEIVLGPGAKGITLDPLKLKGDETEVKLKFHAAADAPVGPAIVTVRISGKVHEFEIANDAKLSVAVK